MSYTVVKQVTQFAWDASGAVAYTPGDEVDTDTALPGEVRWTYVIKDEDPAPSA